MTRYVTEWREEASAPWIVATEYRITLDDEGACQSARQTGRRRRRRETIRDGASTHPNLLDIVPKQRRKPVHAILGAMGINRLEAERTLEAWLADGWVEVEEKQDQAARQWMIDKVRLSEAAFHRLVEQPEVAKREARFAEIDVALAKLHGWRADLEKAFTHRGDEAGLLRQLEAIFEEQETALRRGEWVALPGTTQRPGDAPHQRWLSVLRGVAALLALDRWEYERAFSATWLDDSKQLARDRRDLEAYLGVTFEQLGLFRHTPVVYCWGSFTATVEGFAVDGKAGMPFVALSAETIQHLQDTEVTAAGIFIVENQTAFEAVLRPPLRRDDWLYLFSGGHAGYAERALLSRWLDTQPALPWYIWTDWDLGGVRIQMDWAKWADAQNVNAPVAWMWDRESLARWRPLGTPLTDTMRAQLEALKHPLARQLIEAGYILEQEAALAELKVKDFA